jgi:hypothetical protein
MVRTMADAGPGGRRPGRQTWIKEEPPVAPVIRPSPTPQAEADRRPAFEQPDAERTSRPHTNGPCPRARRRRGVLGMRASWPERDAV